MRLKEDWSWDGDFDFQCENIQSRGSVRYVTMVAAVGVLWYYHNIFMYAQCRKGTYILYYMKLLVRGYRDKYGIEVNVI